MFPKYMNETFTFKGSYPELDKKITNNKGSGMHSS